MNRRMISWTIEIADIVTALRVGIWEHERGFQPIRISMSVRALAAVIPQSIDDCMNYEPICRWIVDTWPAQPHTPLLETKLRELLDFVFAHDARIEWVDIAISKPNAVAAARGVGLRMAIDRGDYEAAFNRQDGVPHEEITYLRLRS
ncbi:MAG: dihydroneopterin aldolase [Massilia sp.]|jgi:dihydroneopterin aldolase|nr:dihydroneopterin aldolase [Massilia sp.]